MMIEKAKKGYNDRLEMADAHMNSKLLIIKKEEKVKE